MTIITCTHEPKAASYVPWIIATRLRMAAIRADSRLSHNVAAGVQEFAKVVHFRPRVFGDAMMSPLDIPIDEDSPMRLGDQFTQGLWG
jgi:hypothetical protein